MFERFTNGAREVVRSTQELSRELGHRHIGTEHLLLALLSPAAGAVPTILGGVGLTPEHVRARVVSLVRTDGLSSADAEALESIGIDVEAVRAKLEETFGPGALEPDPPGSKRRHTRLTPRARKVLELSLREALRLKDRFIAPEHILLGLIREGDGLAAKIMHDAGVDLNRVRTLTTAALRPAA